MQRNLERIRSAILDENYDFTRHAIEEMAEDGLDIFDVENAIMSGKITRMITNDPRGTKYTIIGFSSDERTVIGVVGRFTQTMTYLIITVYEVD